MQGHNIVSARYAHPMPPGGYLDDASVLAEHAIYGMQGRRANDDIDGGGMLAYLAGGGVIEPYVPPALTAADYGQAVQAHIDAVARSRDYRDAVTCASYIGSTVLPWQADAEAFVAWRDSVWAYVYAQLAAVLSEQRAQPTIAELIAELPSITWP